MPRSISDPILSGGHGKASRHMRRQHGRETLRPANGGKPAMNKEQLRAMRIASGLTQESIADRLGLSPRHYKRLESGATRISESLARLVQYELT